MKFSLDTLYVSRYGEEICGNGPATKFVSAVDECQGHRSVWNRKRTCGN